MQIYYPRVLACHRIVNMDLSRRTLMTAALAQAATSIAAPSSLKVVVAGGHPGDPECGCAGTIARYGSLGHRVTLLYLNRGEGYCQGSSPAQCATVRTAEAQQACRILKATPVFATQIDGRAIVDNPHYDDFARLLDSEKADVVFAHWPLDRHRDHRALAKIGRAHV